MTCPPPSETRAEKFETTEQNVPPRRPHLPEETKDPCSSPIARRQIIGAGLVSVLLAPHLHADAQAFGTLGPTAAWKSPELRLVRRVTNGLTAQDAAHAKSMGYQAYLEYQLNDSAIDDSAVDSYIALNYPMLVMSPAQHRTLYVKPQLIQSTLYRRCFSQRQLRERMVEFWSDHFNINIQKTFFKTIDDRDVIRPNALGKFPDLLRASAHSPAMLVYLDNWANRKEAPNQNYARELMELHTLGVNGGFTQKDVMEVARCFTGWTYQTDYTRPDFGTFVFDPTIHDDGQKVVLGHVIPAGGGIRDGETVLTILANHPSTASFIATKMLRWLLREDPPAAQISLVAQVYSNTGGDIKAMIRAILTPSMLQSAPAKYKRPSHLVISALRATGAYHTDLATLQVRIEFLGQPPFQWGPPNGFPDTLAYWSGFILPRWNFGLDLLNGQIPNAGVDSSAVVAAPSVGSAVQIINNSIFAGEMSVTLQAQLAAFMTQNPGGYARVHAIALALGSPDFQWY